MNAAARTDFVIETSALTKRNGDVVAVNDLTLRVPRGGVFGFLGYYRAEQLIVALFLSFFSWFQNVADDLEG